MKSKVRSALIEAARLHSPASQLESGKTQHDHANYQEEPDDYAYTQYKAGVSALEAFFNRAGTSSSETPANP